MEGCLFEAHYNIVFKHQNSEHFNLKSIATKIVKLETPEDIAKWRESRRKNFPTLSRIAERQALKSQINQAYRKNAFGQNNRRFKRPYTNQESNHRSLLSPLKNTAYEIDKQATSEKHATKENLVEKEEGEISDDDEEIVSATEIKSPSIKPSGLCDYPSSDDDLNHERKLPTITSTVEKVSSPTKATCQQKHSISEEKKSTKRCKKDKFIKSKSKRPNLNRRPLTLFEKLLLNDVRREESKIVACLEVLSKVDYKL